jgi:hypothetical protein
LLFVCTAVHGGSAVGTLRMQDQQGGSKDQIQIWKNLIKHKHINYCHDDSYIEHVVYVNGVRVCL